MITFEEARQIVDRALRPDWDDAHGTFMVHPEGYGNARYWHVIAGAFEYVVEDKFEFCLIGSPAYLVDKQTGEIREAHPHADFTVFDGMTPVRV